MDYQSVYWVGTIFATFCIFLSYETYNKDIKGFGFAEFVMIFSSWFIVAVFLAEFMANKLNTGKFFTKERK